MDFTQRISKKSTGMTNDALAESVTSEGYTISSEGVRQWRTGATQPRSVEAVTALERALDITDGSLRDTLGWRAETSIEERVSRIEAALHAAGIPLEDVEYVPLNPGGEQSYATKDEAVRAARSDAARLRADAARVRSDAARVRRGSELDAYMTGASDERVGPPGDAERLADEALSSADGDAQSDAG